VVAIAITTKSTRFLFKIQQLLLPGPHPVGNELGLGGEPEISIIGE
jgi:hypothetical protein